MYRAATSIAAKARIVTSSALKGCTVITRQSYCAPKDGVTFAMANATNHVAGDGTTSATVTAGMNVMGVRHATAMSFKAVATDLRSQARMMSTSGKEVVHNLPDLPFVDAFLMKAKKNKQLLDNRKIWSRRSSILPEFVGGTVRIYNGKTFVRCKITEGKVDHKFGEFALTRKRRPRITASEKKKDKRVK